MPEPPRTIEDGAQRWFWISTGYHREDGPAIVSQEDGLCRQFWHYRGEYFGHIRMNPDGRIDIERQSGRRRFTRQTERLHA